MAADATRGGLVGVVWDVTRFDRATSPNRPYAGHETTVRVFARLGEALEFVREATGVGDPDLGATLGWCRGADAGLGRGS